MCMNGYWFDNLHGQMGQEQIFFDMGLKTDTDYAVQIGKSKRSDGDVRPFGFSYFAGSPYNIPRPWVPTYTRPYFLGSPLMCSTNAY